MIPFLSLFSDTGIEVREASFAIVMDSEISNCGRQGLISHSGARGYALCRYAVYELRHCYSSLFHIRTKEESATNC